MIFEKELIIHSDVETVFNYFVDTTYLKDWVGGLVSIKITKGDEPEVGAESEQVIRQNGKSLKFKQRITQFESNEIFAAEMFGKEMDITLTYLFQEIDEGTLIQVKQDVKLKSFLFKSMKKIVFALMQNSLEEDFIRLKDNIENAER